MSNERQESLADILEELRSGEFARLADRIEAAHFRECEALREERNRAGLTEREKLAPRLRELEAGNARLRAALKPVLECKVMSALAAEIRPGEFDYCSNIIFNAQRIYNEDK